jgi:hypothetical protein
MILKRHTVFDTMANYDPTTGAFATFRRASGHTEETEQIAGSFDYLGDRLVLLFRQGGVLYLQIDDLKTPMHEYTVELQSTGNHRELRLLCSGKVVSAIEYAAPILDPPLALDPTPFVDEEHFDFGLFIANVSRDPTRQGQLYPVS